MIDPLRTLLDTILASMDAPGADRRALAAEVGFSADHLDRVLHAAAGESATAMRRRLLLERAAWQIQRGRSVAGVAQDAGYGSSAAFSRAFARAFGAAPRAFAREPRDVRLEARNGLHFHPPAGLALAPLPAGPRAAAAISERLLEHHIAHSRELLAVVASIEPAAREHPIRPGQIICWFDGEEPTVAVMAERLVAALEVWGAAIGGTEPPDVGGDELLVRFDSAATAFVASCRRIHRENRWGAAFIDALCRPPELFVHADVVAHVLEYGAARRHVLAGALHQLGALPTLKTGDPAARTPAIP